MICRTVCVFLLIGVCLSCAVYAQNEGPFRQLDPTPYDPGKEPDIDLFISHWQESMPRVSHGSLVERDIMTPCEGDPLKPVRRGAVLTYVKRFSHAVLASGNRTTPNSLVDEQMILYIVGGEGVILTDKTEASLHPGVGVLIPPEIDYELTCNAGDDLTMYLIVEPVPEGFSPNSDIRVQDEADARLRGDNLGHWCHIYRQLFWRDDGLATLIGMGPVWFDALTMGQPHSHGPNTEEIWFVLEGEVLVMIDKQLRRLGPGSAYKIPPDFESPHSQINGGDKPVKLFWFMRQGEREAAGER